MKDIERFEKQMAFIREIDKEKMIKRQSYLTDKETHEDDAQHAWHMAIMTLLLKEYSNEEIDVLKTMSMLLKTGGSVRWGHIGDTRVYRFQAGKMVSRTFDHSVPQMLVYSGEIKESQIRFHEDRNRLLKVIGAPWNKPQYEISEASALTDREAFLMCTDGFWEWITEDEMARFLAAARTPAEWLDAMQQHVLRSGRGNNMDNYSAIAVYHGEPWKKRSLFGIFG